ncbi:MAG: DivIVA domain-containing protein [Kineosporiaceae bacterium]|nr:DivIVA domain-containing protein [Kineosporiaceae bacterium]
MTDTFPRASRLAKGYDAEQVEAFLARARAAYEDGGRGGAMTSWHIRTVGFDLVRGGYDVEAVDAALDRIEDAFARREKHRGEERAGANGWQTQLRSQEQSLRAQLARNDGQRFPRGSGLELTYDIDQVDELCRRIEDAFASGRPLSPDAVRLAVFKSRRGARGYREASVDAFLDRVVELLVVAAV